ncbi:MAG: hypothetical protein AB7S26_40280 [Sandaracinaceae bacterium]
MEWLLDAGAELDRREAFESTALILGANAGEVEVRRHAARRVDLDAQLVRRDGEHPEEERVEPVIRPRQQPPPLGAASDRIRTTRQDAARQGHRTPATKLRATAGAETSCALA